MNGLISPRDCEGFTYKVSGMGVGIVVGVGIRVEVGMMVGVVVAGSRVVEDAVPHPKSNTEIKIEKMKFRRIGSSAKDKSR
jgi:hypothetical protein